VRFYLPQQSRWATLAKLTTGLGEALTDAVRGVSRENPRLSGVIDVTDFNATQAGQRMIDDDRLRDLVQVLGHRLKLDAAHAHSFTAWRNRCGSPSRSRV
jgi:type I restriction enzyme M protein